MLPAASDAFRPVPGPHRSRFVWPALFVVLVTAAAYAPLTRNGFITFDDSVYLTDNPAVAQGLTPDAVAWALTTDRAANWHPLTWISHLLDVSLFGLDPRGHHLMNLSIHCLSALILLLVLRRMTGLPGPSTFAAILFALHPLNVESVAWAAERKNTLSTLFLLLALGAYIRYLRRPRWSGYLLLVLLFTLGLLAKPMLVTLPCLLLLLDWWPLGRWRPGHAGIRSGLCLTAEKLPLFALSAVSSLITYHVQQSGGAMSSLVDYGFGVRAANALTAYGSYLFKAVLPIRLAIFYPFPESGPPLGKMVLSALLLALVSAAAIRFRRTHPAALVGWLWFLGTLVPVIGLVKVGEQAMADRYAYVPLLGLFLPLAFAWPRGLPRVSRAMLYTGVGCLTAALLLLTNLQTRQWKDNFTLMDHALRVTTNNWLAHNSKGVALAQLNRLDAALKEYEAALAISPNAAKTWYNIGNVMTRLGRFDDAESAYRRAMLVKPDYAEAYNNLGANFSTLGRRQEAIALFRLALRYWPSYGEAHNNLGIEFALLGEIDQAVTEFAEATRLMPESADARRNLERALAARKQRP